MKDYEKEVELAKLSDEEKELRHLKAIYNKAADDITKKLEISNGKINVLLKDFDELDDVQKSVLQSQIYQRNFQLSLKKQVEGFLSELQTDQYKSIDDYLKKSYDTGFIGSMYSLHKQGIPLVMPIDQKKVAAAIKLDPKISKNLYTKLGEDVNFLKKRIANNVSRGIATASEYKVIARNIANDSNVGFNRAMRIARTEGHNVQCQAAWDAQHKAKDAGADVLKQWEATLDGRTRDSHRMVDGEIRELDEKFSNGMMMPSDPAGGAAEVVNCRCALLQRARWALDEEELQTLKDRATYFGLDKTKNFDDFKEKYLKAAEEVDKNIELDPIYEYKQNKKQIDKTLFKVENERRTLNYEVGTIIDRKGNIINVTGGEAHSVEVPTELLAGNIFTHNHPNGGCFSQEDIKSLVETNLFELRASTPQGIYFSLKVDSDMIDDDIIKHYEKATGISKMMDAIREDFKAGILSKEEAEDFNTILKYKSMYGEKFLEEHAKDYGYSFEKGKIKNE